MKFLTHNTPAHAQFYVCGEVVLHVHTVVRVQVYCVSGTSYLYRHIIMEYLGQKQVNVNKWNVS